MDDIEASVRRWLEEVVIGLNLCPFAARPNKRGQIRIVVCRPADEDVLIDALLAEFALLDDKPAEALETTLLVIDGLLADFDDYRRFVDFAEVLLHQYGWSGRYQLASFHPHYRFDGTAAEDAENLTNRSPLPILHLIREDSLARALERFPHPEKIPERNVACVSALDAATRKKLFPYLFGN